MSSSERQAGAAPDAPPAMTRAPSDPSPTDPGVHNRKVEHLRLALVHRDAIGEAKGIVRVVFRCDEGAAFAALARLSQDTDRTVSDVALMIMDVVTSGHNLTPRAVVSLQRGIEGHHRAD